MKEITLSIADSIADGAIEACRLNGFNDFAVTVVDATGKQIVHKVMDGQNSPAIPLYAIAKAYTCIATMMSSREFRDKYTKDDNVGRYCQMLSMVSITGGKLAPFPGGVLIKNTEGKIIGAVGCSGASADEDEYCALMGIELSGI